MSSGIRHGLIFNQYLLFVCVDQLNRLLGNVGIGCHIASGAMNNFSYAYDLALVAPTASALSLLTSICDDCAEENYIKFNATKFICVCILSLRSGIGKLLNAYFSGNARGYVNTFWYTGDIICSDFNDGEDIRREIRGLCMRGKLVLRRYKLSKVKARCFLLKRICFQCTTLICGVVIEFATIKFLECFWVTHRRTAPELYLLTIKCAHLT